MAKKNGPKETMGRENEQREQAADYTFVDEETGKTVGPRVYDEDRFYIESSDGSSSCSWSIVEAKP